MFREEFALGGPVMYVIFGVWVLMLALIMERSLFWASWMLGGRTAAGHAQPDGPPERRLRLDTERNLVLIDGLSQFATSLGLFGTVLGMARAFFARSDTLSLAAPDVLASGLATALFTTVAGLVVFLVGQAALFVFGGFAASVHDRLAQGPAERETP